MAKKQEPHDNRNAKSGRYETDKQASKHPAQSIRETRKSSGGKRMAASRVR